MALKLNGSSSGYVAVDAPAAAGSNTLVLPTTNGAANQFLANGTSAGSLEWKNDPAISDFDVWRLNAGVCTTDSTLTSNWEQDDEFSFDSTHPGGDMAVNTSTGWWTFPKTGWWIVLFNALLYDPTTIVAANVLIHQTTDNGSNDQQVARGDVSIYGGEGAAAHQNVHVQHIVDVTNTSNVKVKFRCTSPSTICLHGSAALNITYATFIRLRDT